MNVPSDLDLLVLEKFKFIQAKGYFGQFLDWVPIELIPFICEKNLLDRFNYGSHTIIALIRQNNLTILKWFFSNNQKNNLFGVWDLQSILLTSINCGKLEIVQWIDQNLITGDRQQFSMNYMNKAVTNSTPEIAAYLHQQGYPCSNSVVYLAADAGDLTMLKSLHAAGCNHFSHHTMDFAAEKGHLNVVKWLHKNRVEGCSTMAVDRAAKAGMFSTVVWLVENRGEGFTQRGVEWSREAGFVEITEYLTNFS